jgi:hypothetical protein
MKTFLGVISILFSIGTAQAGTASQLQISGCIFRYSSAIATLVYKINMLDAKPGTYATAAEVGASKAQMEDVLSKRTAVLEIISYRDYSPFVSEDLYFYWDREGKDNLLRYAPDLSTEYMKLNRISRAHFFDKAVEKFRDDLVACSGDSEKGSLLSPAQAFRIFATYINNEMKLQK